MYIVIYVKLEFISAGTYTGVTVSTHMSVYMYGQIKVGQES